MKIAILHNFMDNIGGAEIVSLTLGRELNADIYTTNISEEHIRKSGFGDVLSRIHSIGKVPIHAPFKHQLAFWRFRRLNLKNRYDFYIISGDWAMSAAVNNKPNLWYVHSPLNELWQFKDHIRNTILPFWQRPFFDMWVATNRKLTLKYSNHVERFACNSLTTQKRVAQFYNRDAEVIYPPVDTEKYQYKKDTGYWLSVNRLIGNKRIEIQMKAFAKLTDERLIIVGSYEQGARQFENYKKNLGHIKPSNVELIHWVDQETLRRLYSECKGFITTSKDEDFGMSAVEAMASGKFVIAPNEGGYRESVIDGETGILINDIDEDKLSEAVKKTNSLLATPQRQESYAKKCRGRALLFDTTHFITKIREMIA